MKKMKRTCSRIVSVLLAVMLFAAGVQPVMAATARASTMKLAKTTGTVAVKTANGSSRTVSAGMRLYNGYSLETGRSSYAYVSLDDSKAVKLDQNSKAALRQKAKKLELLVQKGQLFFNVKNPLSGNESMNVRTSTMVTGVRGTCGVVESGADNSSTLYLLEGKVSYSIQDPLTGEPKSIDVHGGEKITMVAENGGTQAQVSELRIEDIPLMAIEEVAQDAQLQAKIEATTDLHVADMIQYMEQQTGASGNPGTSSGDDNPGSTPATDPQKPDLGATTNPQNPGSGSAANPQNPGSSSGSSNPPSSGGSSSGSSGSTGGNDSWEPQQPSNPSGPDHSQEPEEPDRPQEPVTVVSGASVTAADLVDAFENANVVVLDGNTAVSITSGAGLQIADGKMLRIAHGSSLTFESDTVLEVLSGAVVVNRGEITLSRGIENKGRFINYGKITGNCFVNQGNSFTENHGEMALQLFKNNGNASLKNYGVIYTSHRYEGTGDSSYTCGDNAVLYSLNPSEGMPSGALLLSTNSIDSLNRLYYAQTLNQNVARLLKEQNVNKVYFAKNAVVPDGATVELALSEIYMNEWELQVRGTLELAIKNCMEGSAPVLIRMQGGTLYLKGESSATSFIRWKDNTPTKQYLIALDGQEDNKIVWENTGLQFMTNPERAIQGIQKITNTSQFYPYKMSEELKKHLQIPEGYHFADNVSCLKLEI